MTRVLLLAAAVSLSSGIAFARGAEQATRVVDETYVCGVAVHNGVRKIAVNAQRGFRDEGRWQWLSTAGVANEDGGPPAKLPPTPTGQIPISYENWGFGASGGLTEAHPDPPLRPYRASVSLTPRRACVASRARVRLSARGLVGGPADYFGDEYECRAPAKVLVRIRAVFAEPATLRIVPSQGELRTRGASGAVREAAVAVRTTSGHPLAYATAAASGAARLFTAGSCTAR